MLGNIRRDITPSKCPTCDLKFNEVTGYRLDNAYPQPGNISLCLQCGEWLVFALDLSVRLPTEEECKEMKNNKDIANSEILRQKYLKLKAMGIL